VIHAAVIRSWLTRWRLTGQARAADLNAELQIVMGLDALLDATNQTPRS
jgi:hypothetical protein